MANVYPPQSNSVRPSVHPFLALLFGLEVVEEDRSLLRLLTPVLDNNAGAVDNLACVSLTVQHTYQIISALSKHNLAWNTYTNQPTRPIAFHQEP